MERLGDWLRHSRTYPDIVKLILHGMVRWRAGDMATPLKDLKFDDVERNFGSEQQIGWRVFIGGRCLSFEWAKVRENSFKWLGSRKLGRIWVAVLIKKLWDVTWGQWECRNGALHNTPVVEDLIGTVSLGRAIFD